MPRTSSIGRAAALTSPPNSVTTGSGSGSRDSHSPASARALARNSSASGARTGVGAADPIPVPTAFRSGCKASPNAATAITIAFLVPIFANCSGPDGGLIQTATISSAGASALRLTPVKNSPTGIIRLPFTELTSISASDASSEG